MRKKGLAVVVAAITAAVFAISGAAATSAPSADLSSAVANLVATGNLPADVTEEPGEWNFAGPASDCPGPGWNCVTPGAAPVHQTGTVNILVADVCDGSTQAGLVNQMHCSQVIEDEEKEAPFIHQTCGTDAEPIEQTGGGHNELICKLIYDVTTTGPAQCVLQEGDFEQDGVTNKFKGQFRIVQQMSSGGTQTQDARQRIKGRQDAEEWNESEVQQVEIQKLTGSATQQNQNTGCPTALQPTPPLVPAAGDCNEDFEGPDAPYTCLKLTQEVASGGKNTSKLKQEVKQDAQTTSLVGTETQGTPNGGNDADVHQEVGGGEETAALNEEPDETGENLGLADQYTYQTLPVRIGLLQNQYEDPFCCSDSQFGPGEETINHWIQQVAGPFATQVARAKGVSRTPDGVCTIHHNIENNGGDVQESRTEEPCPFLRMDSACTSALVIPGEGPPFVSGSCASFSTTEEYGG
jgi:hypothetical protein